jgi:signal transduction histidine kinase
MKKIIIMKSMFKSIYFWILIWLCLVGFYVLSIRNGFSVENWNKIIYLIQMAVDICIGYFGFLCFINKRELVARRFYFLIFLSLIPGLFTNEIYNAVINIAGIRNITVNVNRLWVISYTFFLLIQAIAWSYLLLSNQGKNKSETRIWLTRVSHIQSAAIVIFSFIFISMFRNKIFYEIGSSALINSILETSLFVVISMCLSRTKTKSLIYLEVGFLLLIVFNLAHRFSYTTGHYFKAFDVVWLISLVIIIYGLILSWKNKDNSIAFFEPNSIHVLTSAVFITFATFLLVVFFIVDFIISSIEMNSINISTLLLQNIPSILIFSYVFSLLTSKAVANYLSKPLEEMSRRIDIVYQNKINADKIREEKFKIEEIDKLDSFILNTIVQLQSANRVKADFLMNMSHDFRTPASGIYHMSRSVYKRIADPQLKALQKFVVDSSEQLMSFLDDVLDYSRLDGKKLKLNISKFNVEELINEVGLFISAKVKEKLLNFEIKIKTKKIHYLGDKLLVHRIILNLVSNAVKFTHQGGISIIVRNETIKNKRWMVIQIKDTGIGIDEMNHRLIFEPFNRVESTETSKYSGIGLGLSNINLILKQIGGKILLESSLGKGSTFTVYLQ